MDFEKYTNTSSPGYICNCFDCTGPAHISLVVCGPRTKMSFDTRWYTLIKTCWKGMRTESRKSSDSAKVVKSIRTRVLGSDREHLGSISNAHNSVRVELLYNLRSNTGAGRFSTPTACFFVCDGRRQREGDARHPRLMFGSVIQSVLNMTARWIEEQIA